MTVARRDWASADDAALLEGLMWLLQSRLRRDAFGWWYDFTPQLSVQVATPLDPPVDPFRSGDLHDALFDASRELGLLLLVQQTRHATSIDETPGMPDEFTATARGPLGTFSASAIRPHTAMMRAALGYASHYWGYPDEAPPREDDWEELAERRRTATRPMLRLEERRWETRDAVDRLREQIFADVRELARLRGDAEPHRLPKHVMHLVLLAQLTAHQFDLDRHEAMIALVRAVRRFENSRAGARVRRDLKRAVADLAARALLRPEWDGSFVRVAPDWDRIRDLEIATGVRVGPGERDGFGWVTAVLHTSRDDVVFG